MPQNGWINLFPHVTKDMPNNALILQEDLWHRDWVNEATFFQIHGKQPIQNDKRMKVW